jgi:hypothetical protein
LLVYFYCSIGRCWAVYFLLREATAFCAASSKLSAVMMGKPLCCSSCLPKATLVPERRNQRQGREEEGGYIPSNLTTRGIDNLTSLAAAMMP